MLIDRIRANQSWYWWAARDPRWGHEIDLDPDRYEMMATGGEWNDETPIADWVCVSDQGEFGFGCHLKHDSPPFAIHINRSLDSRQDYWVTDYGLVLLHDRWLSRLQALAPEREFKIGKVFHEGAEQKGWRNVRAGREALLLSTNGHELRYCPTCGRPSAKRAPRGECYLYADAPYDDPVMICRGRIYVRADLVEQADLPDPKNSFPRELIPLYVKA